MKLGTDIPTGKDIVLSTDALRRHLYIVGKSGTGKSVFLEHLALSLIEEGFGVCVLDPHGDLVEKIAHSIPDNRFWKDVLYWEPFDTSHVIGYNPLKDIPVERRPLVTENILSAFSHVWGLSNQHTPRLLHILRNSIRLLLDNHDTSLIDLQRLLVSDFYRLDLLKHCTDYTVRTFWDDEYGKWNAKQRAEYIASLQNKIGALVSNPAMREILSHDYLNPGTLMNKQRVLLANLSKGKLGEESSSLLGSLLTSGFSQAAHERASIPEEHRKDFVLIIDEFQNFTTTAFTGILSEARKYRLSLIVAHQFMSQLPQDLQDAVIGTANTLITFRVGARDAPILSAELDLDQPRQLKNIPNYQAILRTPDSPDVRHMATYPPRPPGKRLEAVRSRTRART